jgi:transaldolase
MNPTRQLHKLGQSLWLDNITREILDNGTLRHYIEDFSITGLTSNPSTFEAAIARGDSYDAAIREKARAGKSGEELFNELALEDLCRAADLFLPLYEASRHIDGWVSMEISPLLAHDALGSIAAARRIHAQAARPNLFVKIPGTPAGLSAVEELIFAGVPINITLLFSRKQYLDAADAFMRGMERRVERGLEANVDSVASLFVSRWDKAVNSFLSEGMRNRLGIAIGLEVHEAYRRLLISRRWLGLAARGARQQRLLWASTGSKDPDASETLYVEALVAPDTIDTVPERTLLALVADGPMASVTAADATEALQMRRRFAELGIDAERLALRLQEEGVQLFIHSWNQLMRGIARKSLERTAAEVVVH